MKNSVISKEKSNRRTFLKTAGAALAAAPALLEQAHAEQPPALIIYSHGLVWNTALPGVAGELLITFDVRAVIGGTGLGTFADAVHPGINSHVAFNLATGQGNVYTLEGTVIRSNDAANVGSGHGRGGGIWRRNDCTYPDRRPHLYGAWPVEPRSPVQRSNTAWLPQIGDLTFKRSGYTTGRAAKSSVAIGSDDAVYVTGTSDGLFGNDFVTVKYVWQTEIAIQLLSPIPPRVNLTLSAAPNSSWSIDRALEPAGPWTNLSTLVIGTNVSAQFQDTNSPYPAGFYRARPQ